MISRNTDRPDPHTRYKFVVNHSNTVENAFLVQYGNKQEDEGDLFVGASFFTDYSYLTGFPIYNQTQSPPKPQSQPVKAQAKP